MFKLFRLVPLSDFSLCFQENITWKVQYRREQGFEVEIFGIEVGEPKIEVNLEILCERDGKESLAKVSEHLMKKRLDRFFLGF